MKCVALQRAFYVWFRIRKPYRVRPCLFRAYAAPMVVTVFLFARPGVRNTFGSPRRTDWLCAWVWWSPGENFTLSASRPQRYCCIASWSPKLRSGLRPESQNMRELNARKKTCCAIGRLDSSPGRARGHIQRLSARHSSSGFGSNLPPFAVICPLPFHV